MDATLADVFTVFGRVNKSNAKACGRTPDVGTRSDCDLASMRHVPKVRQSLARVQRARRDMVRGSAKAKAKAARRYDAALRRYYAFAREMTAATWKAAGWREDGSGT